MAITGKGRILYGWTFQWFKHLEDTVHAVRKETQWPPRDAGPAVFLDWFLSEAGQGITATLNVTDAADTLLADDTDVLVQAALAVSDSVDGLSADTDVLIQATLGATDVGDTLEAVAQTETGITADLNVTDAADALEAAGYVVIAATLTVQDAADGLSASGTIPMQGDLVAQDAVDVLSTSGTLLIVATFDAFDNGDGLSAGGVLLIQGVLDVVDVFDVLDAVGTTLTSIQASLDVTDEGDYLVAQGGNAPLSAGDVTRLVKKMPLKQGKHWQKMYRDYARGQLHSGKVDGPIVTNPRQARAIAYSVEEKARQRDRDEEDNPYNKQR